MNPKRIEIKDNGRRIRVAHAAGTDEFPYHPWERTAQLRIARMWADRLRRTGPPRMIVMDYTDESHERVPVPR